MKTQLQSLQIALHGTQLKYARNTGLFQAICRSGENYQLFLPATAMHLWFSSARGPRVVLIRIGGPISGRPALARSSCSDQLPPDSGRPLTALSSCSDQLPPEVGRLRTATTCSSSGRRAGAAVDSAWRSAAAGSDSCRLATKPNPLARSISYKHKMVLQQKLNIMLKWEFFFFTTMGNMFPHLQLIYTEVDRSYNFHIKRTLAFFSMSILKTKAKYYIITFSIQVHSHHYKL